MTDLGVHLVRWGKMKDGEGTIVQIMVVAADTTGRSE